jgi:hypothetical protein
VNYQGQASFRRNCRLSIRARTFLSPSDAARGWLAKAIEAGGSEIKPRVLNDPDSERL